MPKVSRSAKAHWAGWKKDIAGRGGRGYDEGAMSEFPEECRIWAPWRMEFIHAPKEQGCFLCRIGRDQDKDEENLVIWRGKWCYLVLNRYPYTGGHLMVVPYRHGMDVRGVESEEWREMLEGAKLGEASLEAVMHPHGFNLGINQGGAAGAGAKEHLHLHIVPRWEGDSNFLPVLGGARVVPQALETTAAALREAIAKLGAKNG